MYSLVLMSALTAAPDAPEFNGYFRDLFNRGNCSGCTGCNGSARYSCYGGCCSADYNANSCTGCGGGGVFSGFGTRVRRLFDSGNCCGGSGCCGSFSYGCSGTAYSCFGGPAVAYTPVFNGGLSCQGGLMPYSQGPMFETPPGVYPGSGPPPTIPYAPPEVAPPMGGRPAGFGGTVVGASGATPTARATVLIRLPADAQLYADNAALRLTGPERKFVTPELPTGQEFTYRFRAEYEREGEVISVSKKVVVRAGGSVAIEFTDLTGAKPAVGTTSTPSGSGPVVASPVSNPIVKTPAADTPAVSDRATITVSLPPGATLYVDDRKSSSTDAVRQFTTPPLPAGREFAYLMKAEIVRNGQPESLTQKIAIRGGERVVVDFTGLGK